MKNCPVCGTDAFEEEGTYENCPVCDWTDDVYQEHFPYRKGANHLSLNEAKEKQGSSKQ